MPRDDLHRQVDSFNHTNWHVKALVHALIDLGQVERLECQYESCILDSRDFKPRTKGRGHQIYSLCLDHIDPRRSGGSNRPDNLRLIHASCNVARATRIETETLTEARVRGQARRTDDRKALVAERRPGWNKGIKQRSPLQWRGRVLSVEDAAQLRTLYYEQGWKRRELCERFKIGSTTCSIVVNKRGAYADD